MSTLRPQTALYHHGDVPRAILDTAEQMLTSTPAHAISVRKLAEQVGVSHAAPYRHFGDRFGFLAALAGRCLERLVADQEARASVTDDPAERLIRIGEGYVDWGVGNPHAFQLVFDPDIQESGRRVPALAAAITAHTGLFRASVAAARQAGLLARGGFDTQAATLWSTVHGLTHLVTLGLMDPGEVRPVLQTLVV